MTYQPTIQEVDTASWLDASFEEERDVFAPGARLQESACCSGGQCPEANLDWR